MKKGYATRSRILEAAYAQIYERGFQKTSIDDIVAEASITKGAFYYYFRSKDQMGIAVLNEIVGPGLTHDFTSELYSVHDPMDAIYRAMDTILLGNKALNDRRGCPVSNFIQEMTPWHTQFSGELTNITRQWTQAIAGKIEEGKANGLVRVDINPMDVALFLTSGYWGIRNLGKLGDSRKVYKAYLEQLKTYLSSLRW